MHHCYYGNSEEGLPFGIRIGKSGVCSQKRDYLSEVLRLGLDLIGQNGTEGTLHEVRITSASHNHRDTTHCTVMLDFKVIMKMF